jgi:hypothetical protein
MGLAKLVPPDFRVGWTLALTLPLSPGRGNRYGGRPQGLRGLRPFAGNDLETSKLQRRSNRCERLKAAFPPVS